MSQLTDAISAALIHSLWQNALVGVVLWLMLRTVRLRANARYAVACAGLALMALLPVVTAGVLYRNALRPDLVSPAAGSTYLIVENARVAAAWFDGRLQDGAWLVRFQAWALPMWSIGVLIFSLRLVGSGAHAIALMRRSEDADAGIRSIVCRLARRMGVHQPVRVAISPQSDGPATVGWLHPVILLPPATILGLTPQQLDAVLAHELAHIRRHDYFVNVFQMVIETMFFYHPAVWWASARIRNERELCCDDLAVGTCGDALCYAQALTLVAKWRVAAAGMAVGATGGALLQRIERLLGRSTRREHQSRWPVLIALSLTVAIAALNVTWIRALAQGDEPVYSGLWEIRSSTTAGFAELRLCYADLFSRTEMPADRIDSLLPTRLAGSDGPIRFELRRDAGTFRFDGTMRSGVGAGTYTFSPGARFSRELETRGFEQPTSSAQHSLALYDLGLTVVDGMRAQGILRADVSLLVRQANLRALREDLHGRLDGTRHRSNGWC